MIKHKKATVWFQTEKIQVMLKVIQSIQYIDTHSEMWFQDVYPIIMANILIVTTCLTCVMNHKLMCDKLLSEKYT